MTGGSSGIDPYVIIVGDPCSEFARAMVRLVREYQVETMQCDDVYAAVVAAARAGARRALVLGSMRELAREGSRFFRIAEMNSLQCCCLVENGSVAGGDMLAALRAGAAIVMETHEVSPILQDWLADVRPRDVRGSLSDLDDEDLRATEAELSALLGQGDGRLV